MRHALLSLVFLLAVGPLAADAAPVGPVRPAAPAVAAPADIPSELTDYVFKEDKSFSWKLTDTTKADAGTVYTIDLVSQTWHDIKWDHKLQVYVAKDVKPTATMVLWNQGGTPDLVSSVVGLQLSAKTKAPVAFLFGVPKQPLFGGKTEDALIAETFVRYLETNDATWPLLFPMVKSIVRAMDALQAFAEREWKAEVKDFLITGGSKRGWTSWLTAATGDKRVKAIAPLVIDTLNIPVQMQNQVKAFGGPSEMIKDYSNRKLIPVPKTEAAQKLWRMIDPWTYRERITCPKMIVNGTNDPYWPLDALNTYWDGLKGDTWVLYVPNAGHDLCERDAKGKKDTLPLRAIDTVSAFARCQINGKAMPKVNCDLVCPAGAECLDVSLLCDVKPLGCRVYSAASTTRDFRKALWEPKAIDIDGKKTACKVDAPASGLRAAFVELTFEADGEKFTLSTPLRIIEPAKK